MGRKTTDIIFKNHFHNTEITVRVKSGRISRSTAYRIKRELCGVRDCSCGVGCCGTRSNAGARTWIFSDDGRRVFDEEPEWSYDGRLLGVRLEEA